MVDFGNRLKTLRIQNNMTQFQLSQKLGLTKSVISAYENGLRMPSYDVLIAISNIFRVTTDFLLGIEHKNNIDLSGLSLEEVDALLNLISAMKRKNNTILWIKIVLFMLSHFIYFFPISHPALLFPSQQLKF